MIFVSVIHSGELQQILSQDRHPSYSAEFYSSYINILLGVFYSVCRDLRELRHLVRHMLITFFTVRFSESLGSFITLFFILNQAALNFSKFCEPLAEGKGNT